MTANAKTLARKEQFKKLGQAISNHVWDKDLGSTYAHPWGVRKSGGFDTLQIITTPNMSKLERRSLQTEIVDAE